MVFLYFYSSLSFFPFFLYLTPRDIDKIMAYLQVRKLAGEIAPEGASVRPRQTLLFSATFSKEVREVAAVTLRSGYTVVDTVGEEVEQTHSHVVQEMMAVPVGTLFFLYSTVMSRKKRGEGG